MKGADQLVRRTLDIIAHFDPLFWWLENPRGGYLKDRGLLDRFPFIDVDYCQFEVWGYKKPTRIWGSAQIGNLTSKLCHPGCPNLDPQTNRHFQQLGGYGPQVSPWNKGRIPEGLILYLLSSAPDVGPGNQAPLWGEEGRDENLFRSSHSLSSQVVHSGVTGVFEGVLDNGFMLEGIQALDLVLGKPGVDFSAGRKGQSSELDRPAGGDPRTPVVQEGGDPRTLHWGKGQGVASPRADLQDVLHHPSEVPPVSVSLAANIGTLGLNNECGTPPHSPSKAHIREVLVPFYALERSKDVDPGSTNLQLVLPLTLLVGGKEVIKVRALVDTGAQANLINNSLIPRSCLVWAKEQLHLVAANGLSIPGGSYEVHSQTTFQQITKAGKLVGVQDLEVSFHVAQLGLDAILSYPWLATNGLVVSPQENSLMLSHPQQLFLQPWKEGVQWMSVERSGRTKEVDMVKVGRERLGTYDVQPFGEDNCAVDATSQARNASACVCECVAPGLEDSPGQLGEALQDFEPRPQPGVDAGEPGSRDSLGQQDKALLKETRPWPRLEGAPGSGDSPAQLGGNLHTFPTRSRPGEGEGETGWRDSSIQLEGALPTQPRPRPRPQVGCVGVGVGVLLDNIRDVPSRVMVKRMDASGKPGKCVLVVEKGPSSPRNLQIPNVRFTLPAEEVSNTKGYFVTIPEPLPEASHTDAHIPPEVTFFGITYPLWDDGTQRLARRVNQVRTSFGGRKRWGRKRSDYWMTQR